MSRWTLCVDFGTAYSKAAAAPADAWGNFTPAAVRPLMVGGEGGSSAFLLDSAVFIEPDSISFGRAAKVRAQAQPASKRAALGSFKTLLSAPDLERALNTAPPASIDPTRSFAMRDLIVLYLAFLSARIARAVAADPMLAGARGFARRYAAPAWRGGDSVSSAHRTVAGLFAEADAVADALGPALLAGDGVAIGAARTALAAAQGASPLPDLGLIFEGAAAAAYTAVGFARRASHLIVLDMGAGTTDIAALSGAGERMRELKEARATIKQAGDFIDHVLANIAIEKARAATPQAQAAVWRTILAGMRDFKDTLFSEGRAAFRFDGRVITITLAELERDRDFKTLLKGVSAAYEHGLGVLAAQAHAEGTKEIQAVAVGGGAAAPFVQKLVRKKPRGGKVNVAARPATPQWAHAPEFAGNLAPVFPQLAIAIGGALAPEGMLAACGVMQPALAPSDSLPARD